MSVFSLLAIGLVVVVLISAAGGKVRINRREVEDLEAKLRPQPGVEAASRARGAAEREEWDDGEAEFEAFVSGLGLPDGSDVEFVVEGIVLGRVALERGRARLEFDSRSGEDVPPIAADQRIEVHHGGTVLMVGQFRHD
jgi:uncharacterized protein (DUF58 family)